MIHVSLNVRYLQLVIFAIQVNTTPWWILSKTVRSNSTVAILGIGIGSRLGFIYD